MHTLCDEVEMDAATGETILCRAVRKAINYGTKFRLRLDMEIEVGSRSDRGKGEVEKTDYLWLRTFLW